MENQKAVVKWTGKDHHEGDDIGVYVGDECVASFNSRFDDGAFCYAETYADRVNQGINFPGLKA